MGEGKHVHSWESVVRGRTTSEKNHKMPYSSAFDKRICFPVLSFADSHVSAS